MYVLAEPPNLLVNDNADKVNEPYKGSADEENDGNNDSNCVLSVYALDKSVNCPCNVKYRKAKDELKYPRKIVKRLDNVFHKKHLFNLDFGIYRLPLYTITTNLSICNFYLSKEKILTPPRYRRGF